MQVFGSGIDLRDLVGHEPGKWCVVARRLRPKIFDHKLNCYHGGRKARMQNRFMMCQSIPGLIYFLQMIGYVGALDLFVGKHSFK